MGASHICKNIEDSVFYLMHPFSLLAFSPTIASCLLPKSEIASFLATLRDFWVFTCIEMRPQRSPLLGSLARSPTYKMHSGEGQFCKKTNKTAIAYNAQRKPAKISLAPGPYQLRKLHRNAHGRVVQLPPFNTRCLPSK